MRIVGKLVVIAALLGTVSSAQAMTAQQEIRRDYNGFAQLFDQKQFGTLEGMMPPSFTTVIGGRTLTKSQFIGSLRGMGTPLVHPNMSFIVRNFTRHRDQTMVTAYMTLVAGVPGKDGKLHRLVYHQAERATWIYTPKGWAPMHSVVLSSSQMVDGRRVTHM